MRGKNHNREREKHKNNPKKRFGDANKRLESFCLKKKPVTFHFIRMNSKIISIKEKEKKTSFRSFEMIGNSTIISMRISTHNINHKVRGSKCLTQGTIIELFDIAHVRAWFQED